MQTFFFAMKTNRRMPIIRGILSKAIAQWLCKRLETLKQGMLQFNLQSKWTVRQWSRNGGGRHGPSKVCDRGACPPLTYWNAHCFQLQPFTLSQLPLDL
jgi:hypothetical protein